MDGLEWNGGGYGFLVGGRGGGEEVGYMGVWWYLVATV